MNKVESLYKEYFNKPVPYSENWKYILFEKLNKKRFYRQKKYLTIGFAFVISVIITISSVSLYNNYIINKNNQYIKSILLSDTAIDFVTYENIGFLIEKYYLQNDSLFEDSNELKESIKNSLIVYYYLNNNNNNKTFKVTEQVLEETVTDIINYFNQRFEEGIL